MEEFKKLGISNYYAYSQAKLDKTRIQFGWIKVDSINLNQPIVIARDSTNNNWDNATSLSDYSTFFLRLTSLTPDEFLSRWSDVSRELEAYWKSTRTSGPEYDINFILKLAYLIRDKKSFDFEGKSYSIVNFDITK